MRADVKLGRVAGFPFSANWSVLVIAALITWNLAEGSLPHHAPGHAAGVYWVTGGGIALFFFISLLAHELAHAVVARRNGVEVKGLTLWLLGGVATLGSDPPTPGADFRIAAAGPATSLGLAAGFWTLAFGLQSLGIGHLVVVAASWLTAINLMLGVFNLLPGAPLDGGRLLRALLWHRCGDPARAALAAARAGEGVAYVLVGLGLLGFIIGAGIDALWLAFVGWFVLAAARAEAESVRIRQTIGMLRVAEVMSPPPHVAPDRLDDVPVATPADPLIDVVERLIADGGDRAIVVDHGTLVGTVVLDDVRRTVGRLAPRDSRPSTSR